MMNKNIFNQRISYTFGGLSKIGYIIMLMGLIVMLSPFYLEDQNSDVKAFWVGIVTILIGVLFSFTYEGFKFDFEHDAYMHYTTVVGITFGKWQKIPPFKKIQTLEHTFIASTISNGVTPSASIKSKEYIAGLFTDQKKPLLVIKNKNLKKLLSDAELISKKLGIELENKLATKI
jgi:hypothetical protein